MSSPDARTDIMSEYDEAKKTARAYLQAVGVLAVDGISAAEYRERETRVMRDAILRGRNEVIALPDDPVARDAVMRARRFLHNDHDPDILETLLANEHKPAYHEALEVLKCTLLETGADMPERLRVWKPDSERVTGRWRQEPTRNQQIGMVVEAMVQWTNFPYSYGDSEKDRVQLQRQREQLQGDLQAICEAAEKPIEELSNEHVIESLNRMKTRPWRTWNGGEGLTEHDLAELTRQPSLAPARVDRINVQTEVRTHFPNLYATRNDATRDTDRAYSICDAVADVLSEATPRGNDYRTVRRAWMAYRDTNLPRDR